MQELFEKIRELENKSGNIRPELQKLAAKYGIEGTNAKGNAELFDELRALGGGTKGGCEKTITSSELVNMISKELGEQFERHRIDVNGNIGASREIDIAIHEDMDEIQAFASDLREDWQAAIAFNGLRGQPRKHIQGAMRRACEKLGLKVRVAGYTIV